VARYKYRTLQHVKMGPETTYLPFTEVVVEEEDKVIWDQLVKFKAAELVIEEVKPIEEIRPRARRKPGVPAD